MNKITKISEPHRTDSKKSHSPTLFNLSDLDRKKVELKFTLEETSNDGGLLLLREMENQLGLIKGLENCIKDERHQSYTDHSINAMISQRIMQISAGYEQGKRTINL